MAYVSPNFKTKKALKEAIRDGVTVGVFQPGLGTIPTNGTISLEGPHSPEPHKWYAMGTMKDDVLVQVDSQKRPDPTRGNAIHDNQGKALGMSRDSRLSEQDR